jgi:phage-related tail protein
MVCRVCCVEEAAASITRARDEYGGQVGFAVRWARVGNLVRQQHFCGPTVAADANLVQQHKLGATQTNAMQTRFSLSWRLAHSDTNSTARTMTTTKMTVATTKMTTALHDTIRSSAPSMPHRPVRAECHLSSTPRRVWRQEPAAQSTPLQTRRRSSTAQVCDSLAAVGNELAELCRRAELERQLDSTRRPGRPRHS